MFKIVGTKADKIDEMTKFFLVMTFLFLGVAKSFAFNEATQTVTLDGFLYKKGTTSPLVESSILLKIQILNPAANCILYEEQQSVNTASSKGYFSIQVGSLTGNVKRTVNDPGRTMAQIFQNTAAIVANDISVGSCAGGAYIPTNSDVRYFRVTVTPGSTGLADALTPDIVVDSVPQAIVAQSLQGLERANVLAVNTSGTVNLSQTNLESLFSGSGWTNLQSILSGNFLKTDTSGATLPSYASTPAGVSIGDMWYDSTTNEIKYQTNAGTQIVGATGSVNGNSITSGTISGSTAWNTSGNITTIGTVAATTMTGANVQATNLRIFNGSNYVQLTAQAMSSNYTLSLPPADGVSGQVMATNGSGALSWVTPSGGVAGTISVGQGGTASTSFAANRIIASNGTGSALQAFSCALNQVISFDASGNAACQNVSSIYSGIQNGGNSTGAAVSIGTNDNYALQFKVNNSIAMTISNNGNVGLGSADPTEPLHVVANNPNLLLKRNSNASDTKIMMVPNGTVDTNNPTYQFSQAGSGYNHFALQVYDGATTSNAIYISRLSNVGIGGSPISKFDIVGTSQTSALSYSRASTDSGLGINPYVTAPGDGYKRFVDFIAWGDSQNGIASTMRFFTQNSSNAYSPKLLIAGDGNIGIGNTAPSSALDISGSLTIRGLGAPAVSPVGQGRIYFDSTSGTFKISQNGNAYTDLTSAAVSSPFTALTDVPNTYSGSAGQFLRVNSSGNGIEFTSASVSVVSGQPAPAGIAAGSNMSIQFNSAGNISGSANLKWDDGLSQFVVTGDILYSGALTNTSDVRKKESIESAGDGQEILKKILQLNAYRYNYKSDPKKEKHIGVIAQEVEKNFPEVVKTQKDADKTKSVDYQAMVPLLIEAIKEQQKMIDQQSRELEELKGQLKRMSSE